MAYTESNIGVYDAEIEFISAILSDPETILEHEEIAAQDFSDEKNREVFKLIIDLYYNQGIDLPHLEDELSVLIHKNERSGKRLGVTSDDLLKYTGLIGRHTSIQDVDSLAEVIKNRSLKRQAEIGMKTILNTVQEEPVSYTMGEIEELSLHLHEQGETAHGYDAYSAFAKAQEFADYMRQNKPPLTGFSRLDDVSLGLIPSLWTIGGSTSVGKSTFLHQCLKGLMESGAKGLVFSLEDDYDTKYLKLACNIAGVPFRQAKFQRYESEADEMLMRDAIRVVQDYPLRIMDDAFDIKSIFLRTKKAVIQNKIDFIAVDYIQNVHVPGANGIYDHMKEVVMQLYKIQKKFGIAVIMISQLSREGRLKGAGEIENQSDLVVMIEKVEKGLDSQFYEIKGNRLLWLQVTKNRLMGKTATGKFAIPIEYTPSWMGMVESDWPEENERFKQRRAESVGNRGNGLI